MNMTDQEVITNKNDAEFIKRPHLWPHEALPLKKAWDGDDLPIGVLIYKHEQIVVLENMSIMGISFGQEVIERTYATAEEVVADGWRVD